MRKIAFCLSGQPRTWKKCYQSWFNLFKPHGDIDVFFHLWDYNSDANWGGERDGGKLVEFPLSEDEKLELVTTLRPVAYEFESKKNTAVRNPAVKNIIADYSHSQFYSMMKVANLKRQFEIKNGFEYDVVVRLRCDLLIPNKWTPLSVLPLDMSVWFETLKPNTAYTYGNQWVTEEGYMRIADIFFLADSLTFDHISLFYDCFNYIEADAAVPNKKFYPPEAAFYFYLSSIGVDNIPIPISDIRLMRDIRHVARIGKLQHYETS